MNRILKFRVWDTKSKKFLEFIPPREYMLDCDEWDHHDLDADGEGSLTYPNTVCQTTFGNRLIWQQFTGLYDNNKKEVFEGDIIETLDYGDEKNNYELCPDGDRHKICYGKVYSGEKFAPFDLEGRLYDFYGSFPEHFIVIGNIFQNPELLEKNK